MGALVWWIAGLARAQDADGDTLLDADEDLNFDGEPANDDSDGDGLPNYLDPDDDDDKVDTLCEITFGVDPLQSDVDGDTILDGDEWFNFIYLDLVLTQGKPISPSEYSDTNGGLSGLDCFSPWDRDSDGVINALDIDDDGDGLATGIDDPVTDLDCLSGTFIPEGDGIPAYVDRDSDDDGLLDDVTGTSGEGLGDVDSDGIYDFLDCDDVIFTGDDDVDGIRNGDEDARCPPSTDPPCAIDPDVDHDGVIDGVEVGPDLAAPRDTDGDMSADWLDPDDDGDGRLTRDEVGMPCAEPLGSLYATDHWSFTCGANVYDLGANVLAAYPDSDGDQLPDFRDRDDDDDGLLTLFEDALGTDPLSGDSDGDGFGDAREVGTVQFALDTDADAIIDALDDDDDGDGFPSAEEGEADDDGDGIPAYLDPDEPDAGTTGGTTSPPTTEPGADPELPKDPEPDYGCTCRVASQGGLPAGAGWLALGALLGLWRRRVEAARV